MKRAHLIANPKSGLGQGGNLSDQAKTICNELGYELIEYVVSDPSQLEKKIEEAVKNAENETDVLIAAGGDGTIRSVAQMAQNSKVRLGIVPCGTFNFFARTHQIPEDHLLAFRLALEGTAQPVRLGKVNEHVFLNNASLGLYSRIIRDRENRTDRFGRNRLVVILSTFLTFFSKHFLLKVSIIIDEKVTSMYTPMIFIGNNTLQLRDLSLSVAGCMKQNYLAVVLMKPLRKLEIFRILWRGFFKTLDDEESLTNFCVDSMTIHTRKSSHSMALDGELIQVFSPLKIQSYPGILNLVKPKSEAPKETP